MGDQSKLVQLERDDALNMAGGWRPSESDRRYQDNQMLAAQDALLSCVLLGVVASWYLIDTATLADGDEFAPGDFVCLSGSTLGPRYVQKAYGAVLEALGHGILGVCLTGGTAGAVLVAVDGVVPPSVTGLGTAAEPYVYLSGARGHSEAAVEEGDVIVGTKDAAGNLLLGKATVAPAAATHIYVLHAMSIATNSAVAAAPLLLGAVLFDPNVIPIAPGQTRNVYFDIIGQASSGAHALCVDLWDTAGAVTITGSQQTINATAPTYARATVAALADGGLDPLIVQLRLWMASVAEGEDVTLLHASLVVQASVD